MYVTLWNIPENGLHTREKTGLIINSQLNKHSQVYCILRKLACFRLQFPWFKSQSVYSVTFKMKKKYIFSKFFHGSMVKHFGSSCSASGQTETPLYQGLWVLAAVLLRLVLMKRLKRTCKDCYKNLEYLSKYVRITYNSRLTNKQRKYFDPRQTSPRCPQMLMNLIGLLFQPCWW